MRKLLVLFVLILGTPLLAWGGMQITSPAVSGTNTGDETSATIAAKLSSGGVVKVNPDTVTLGTYCLSTDRIQVLNAGGTDCVSGVRTGGSSYSSSVVIGATWHGSGAGSPDGSVTAVVGSTYWRTDGTAGNTLYVKESGTGNTGWNPAGAAATMYWNNGGKTITNPTTSDIYPHFRTFVARHLTQATLLVVGGTSVRGKLQKCSSVGASCSDISDALTVAAGAEDTFLMSAGAINTALTAGDRVYFMPTTVTGAVTSITVDLGGVIP